MGIGWRQQFRDRAHGEIQSTHRAIFPWEDFVILTIVKKEVFIDKPLGFVGVGHGLEKLEGLKKVKAAPAWMLPSVSKAG
jgi:hypothetical protein